MPGSLLRLSSELRAALAEFEARCYCPADCARLAEELAATEKACASARLLAVARAVSSGAHQERGFPDGASWLAKQSGGTGGQARQALRTAARLDELPETKSALLAGAISIAQAAEITEAESQTPGAEAPLLAAARSGDLSRLRDQAREHLQAHTDPGQLRQRQLAAREFRHWRDRLGLVRFCGALPPETGLPLVRRVELAAVRARRAARTGGGPPERFEAFAADALCGLLRSSPGAERRPVDARGDGARVELVVVCDIRAWKRGHAHPGEPCQIIGGGPIPVETARELSKNAFLKAVLHDGVAIHTVRHFGRHLPAPLRTALDLGPVPDFTGRRCEDCGSHWSLEYDHVDPLANGGPTSYANLRARCWKDHQDKTERDRRAGLLGPAGRQRAP